MNAYAELFVAYQDVIYAGEIRSPNERQLALRLEWALKNYDRNAPTSLRHVLNDKLQEMSNKAQKVLERTASGATHFLPSA